MPASEKTHRGAWLGIALSRIDNVLAENVSSFLKNTAEAAALAKEEPKLAGAGGSRRGGTAQISKPRVWPAAMMQMLDMMAFGLDTSQRLACQVQVPYARLGGIQAALAVMHSGLQPDIASHATPPRPWRSSVRSAGSPC
ncbi:hypothetical protein CVIRNUC_011030 [Coccomyxa viridis]|uniref:Uncharacterized protein n=1 Tax=Coccomyxa viridis TaxID=1274662 RepID=A0AAV1IKM4_9CHLO|nr:hypothetical protein CVIRNUC_011030 [Coccomyxa viridis]